MLFARRCKTAVERFAVVTVALFEVPVFLIRNREIFRNEIVYPFSIWSFGHTVIGIDHASRLYFPHRISLVFVPNCCSNSYVPLCFGHNVDVFLHRSVLGDLQGRGETARFAILRFWLLLVSGVTNRFTVVDQRTTYKTVSLAEGRLRGGDRDGTRVEPATDFTGYTRLLHEGIGQAPALTAELVDSCRRLIAERQPSFLERPFATLHLREKGRDEPFDSAVRCCGPQENYREAARFLTQSGYHVVGSGETCHEVFSDIPGYVALDDTALPAALLNIFLLTECTLFVGQMSGPCVLASTAGVPSVICDAMTHRLGTFSSEDLLVFKELRFAQSGRLLSLPEIYLDHPDLAYGAGFAEKGVLIEPSTPSAILAGVEEAVARLEGRLELTKDDEELIEGFEKLVSTDMPLAYFGNRPPLNALRAARGELLQLPPGAPGGDS